MATAEALPNLRERSRLETRERLIAAGTELFARRGFARTRAADISHQAGVAVGTLYLHFADKEELLIAILDEPIHRMTTDLRAIREAVSNPDLRTRARAKATLCCCPPLSCLGNRSSRPPNWTRAKDPSTFCLMTSFVSLLICKPKAKLSNTVIWGQRA